jgi:hypothetical protein
MPLRYKQLLSNYGQSKLNEKDADILIQSSGGAVLWQKERLLNHSIKALAKASRGLIVM